MMAVEWDSNMFAMDEVTAKLIIEMHMEDMASLKASTKGKGRAGEKSDADFAFELYRQELDNCAIVVSDRLMTRSIAHAVESDGQVLMNDYQKEDLVARDHALALSGSIPDTTIKVVDFNDQDVEEQIMNDEVLEKLAAKYLNYYDVDTSSGLTETQKECMDNGEPSAWAASRPIFASSRSSNESRTEVASRPCVSCGDDIKFFDLARVPCGHEYCQPCLQELFRLAMNDESLFPPRCCKQHITIGSVRVWLGTNLAVSFNNKKIEMDTPEKTYCNKCSEWIRPEHIRGDVVTCPKCKAKTCTMCKAAAHTGDCPNDTALQQVLEIAERELWRRCYSCLRIVELATGCNHITCRCGAQFCYTCGARWHTCGCVLWDEGRLMQRANVLVDRAGARRQAMPIPPAQNIQPPMLYPRREPINLTERQPQPPPQPVAASHPTQAPLPVVPPVRPAHKSVSVPRPRGTQILDDHSILAREAAAKGLTYGDLPLAGISKKLIPALQATVAKPESSKQPLSTQSNFIIPPVISRESNTTLNTKINETKREIPKFSSNLMEENMNVAAQPPLVSKDTREPHSPPPSLLTPPSANANEKKGKQVEAIPVPTTNQPRLVLGNTPEPHSHPSSILTPPSPSASVVNSKQDKVVPAPATIVSRAKLILAAMQRLRENHQCEHQKWKYISGKHQCEECRSWLPDYIFECRQCEIQACNRCRRNRL